MANIYKKPISTTKRAKLSRRVEKFHFINMHEPVPLKNLLLSKNFFYPTQIDHQREGVPPFLGTLLADSVSPLF